MVLINSVLLIAGSMVVFLYFLGCDPFSSDKIANKNQTGTFWIFLIFDEYAPTFTGILFSSIVCYSVVQHSNGMSLCANTIYCEILNPIFQVAKIRWKEHTIKIFSVPLKISNVPQVGNRWSILFFWSLSYKMNFTLKSLNCSKNHQ